MDDFESYLFIISRMLSYDEDEDRISSEQFSLILGPNYVISFQERVGDLFETVRERLRGKKGRIRRMGADYLMYGTFDVDSYCWHVLRLWPELEMGNLRFFARVQGLPAGDEEVGKLLARVGLDTRANDRAGDYSSGMRQRLKWAFALLGDPAGLLLDEPGVTLDEGGFTLSGDLVGEAREAGRVVVVATNDSREIGYGDDRLKLG